MLTDQDIDDLISFQGSEEHRRDLYRIIANDPQEAVRYAARKNKTVFADLPYTVARPVRRQALQRVLTILTRVAALLLLPLCIYLMYDRSRIQPISGEPTSIVEQIERQQDVLLTQYVHNGVKGIVELSDGTTVWLNSGSTLKYPDRFTSAIRSVTLDGEAYFKVQADSLHPFCIQCNDRLVVKVTGTEFCLSSYRGEPTQIHLVKGSVEVLRDDRRIARLAPCDVFTLQQEAEKVDHETPIQVEKSALWKRDILLFENVPMKEVITRLERWYGVEIRVENPDILRYNFTAEFNAESLTQVLDMLQITSKIDYRISGKQVALR